MRAAAQPMVLDGSHGEGGGALFRTALAIAALTQQAVRIHNIRGAMRKTGLQAEDLAFVHALAASTRAEVSGDELGHNDLTFSPTRSPRPIQHRLDIGEYEKGGVPGNALIVLEALLPVLCRAGGYSKLIAHGETYNPNTLTFDAFERVSLAAHRRQGLVAFPSQVVAGFGYAARGEVGLEVEPSALHGIEWTTRGKLKEAQAVIAYAELQPTIAERAATETVRLLGMLKLEVEPEIVEVRSRTPGVHVTLMAEFDRGFGVGSAMGQRGVKVENVVGHAFDAFAEWFRSDATVDPFLADQLLLPAVLAGEPTSFTTSRVTQRLITMSWVIKQFLPSHITVLGREGERGAITISR